MRETCSRPVTLAIAAAVVCLLVYLRALSCDFVNWDDPDYVLNNELIRTLDWGFIRTIFTSIPYDFYIPLTTLSLALDYHFWGLDPFGFHLTNIVLHAVNCGLLVLLTARLLPAMDREGVIPDRGWLFAVPLLLAGLLFALHPLRVESVAWVTERKDVLNGFFVLLSLLCYCAYAGKRLAGGKVWCREYGLAFLFFVFSLMSKPSSIVLPAMLLVLDWYPLGRVNRGTVIPLLLEKVPFFICAAATVPATMVRFAELDTFHPVGFFPISIRAIVSGNALFEYFRLTILPVGILPYYDLPLAIPRIFIVKAAAVLLLLAGMLWWGRRKPWLPAALGLFILPLVPVLPFLGNGASIALAARYTYLPAIFPSVFLAYLLADRLSRSLADGRLVGARVMVTGVLLLLVCYGAGTWQQIGVWKDSGTMWSRVIESHPFDRAYFYRGLHYAETGSYQAAVEDYTACLNLFAENSLPDIHNLFAFRGEARALAGDYRGAVADFNLAIERFPHRLYYYHRGMALQKLGLFGAAEQDFLRAGAAKGKMVWFANGTPID